MVGQISDLYKKIELEELHERIVFLEEERKYLREELAKKDIVEINLRDEVYQLQCALALEINKNKQ